MEKLREWTRAFRIIFNTAKIFQYHEEAAKIIQS